MTPPTFAIADFVELRIWGHDSSCHWLTNCQVADVVSNPLRYTIENLDAGQNHVLPPDERFFGGVHPDDLRFIRAPFHDPKPAGVAPLEAPTMTSIPVAELDELRHAAEELKELNRRVGVEHPHYDLSKTFTDNLSDLITLFRELTEEVNVKLRPHVGMRGESSTPRRVVELTAARLTRQTEALARQDIELDQVKALLERSMGDRYDHKDTISANLETAMTRAHKLIEAVLVQLRGPMASTTPEMTSDPMLVISIMAERFANQRKSINQLGKKDVELEAIRSLFQAAGYRIHDVDTVSLVRELLDTASARSHKLVELGPEHLHSGLTLAVWGKVIPTEANDFASFVMKLLRDLDVQVVSAHTGTPTEKAEEPDVPDAPSFDDFAELMQVAGKEISTAWAAFTETVSKGFKK